MIQDRKIFHSGDIIKELTQELDAAGSKELQCEMKVSVALFDNNARTLQFSGINQDMIIFDGDEMVVLEGESPEHANDLMADKIDITDGSTYYMFSNGFYNQENQDGVRFSQEKFEEMLKSIHTKPLNEQYQFLSQTIDDWKSDSGLNDDISIIGFKL